MCGTEVFGFLGFSGMGLGGIGCIGCRGLGVKGVGFRLQGLGFRFRFGLLDPCRQQCYILVMIKAQ